MMWANERGYRRRINWASPVLPDRVRSECARSTGAVGLAQPPPSTDREMKERCESGRIGRSRKPLSGQLDRGFESHPLRQTALAL